MVSKSRKTAKVLLATSLALGGGVITESFLPSQEASAAYKSHVQDVAAYYASEAPNAFRAVVTVGGSAENMDDFNNSERHKATYTIQNSSGQIVKSGTLNAWQYVEYPNYNPFEFKSNTNMSVSTLAPGYYRIKISIAVDDGAITSVNDSDLTQAFTLNSNRSITDIRP